MTKAKKKKYYAIKEGNGVHDKIVTTWNECQKYVLHYPAIYKSFFSEADAKRYLSEIKQENIAEIKVSNKKAMEYNKMKKEKTKPIVGLRIDSMLFEKFQKKCDVYEIDMKKAIMNMIIEWTE